MLVCPECSSQKNLENQNNKNFFGGPSVTMLSVLNVLKTEATKMGKLRIIDSSDANRQLDSFFEQSVAYTLLRSPDGKPLFMLSKKEDIIVNPDLSVTWSAREIGVGPHSFIELTTGESHRKTVYLPLCLVNPETRNSYNMLLESTVGTEGKLNEREAKCYVLTPNLIGALVNIKLENLCLHYVCCSFSP